MTIEIFDNLFNQYQQKDLLLVVKYLTTTGLIEYVEKSGYQGIKIHRLIQQEINKYVSDNLGKTDFVAKQDVIDNLLSVIVELTPCIGEVSDNSVIRADTIINTAKKVLSLAKSSKQNHEHYFLTHAIGKYYYITVEDYQSAKNYWEQAMNILNMLHETTDYEIISSLHNLASVFGKLGNNNKALEYYNKILKIDTNCKADKYPELAASVFNGLGAIYNALNDFTESLQYYEKCLSIRQKYLNTCAISPLHIADIKNNIGEIYTQLGDYVRGKSYLSEALAIYKKHNSDLHIAIVYANLGILNRKLGAFSDAIEFLTSAKNIIHTLYTIETITIVRIYEELGIVHRLKKELQEAKKYHKDALKIMQAYYANHEYIAAVKQGLGNVFRELKKYNKALKYYDAALHVGETNANARLIANNCNNIGVIHLEHKKYSNAIECFERALTVRQLIYTRQGNHPDIAEVLHNLAISYKGLKNFQQSLEYHLKSLAMVQNLPNKYTISHATILYELCKTYIEIKEFDCAMECIIKVYNIIANCNVHLDNLQVVNILIFLAQKCDLDVKLLIAVYQECYKNDMDFADYKSYQSMSYILRSNNQLEMALTASKLAAILIYSKKDFLGNDKTNDQCCIQYHMGFIYSIMAQKATSSNEQEKYQYAVKAKESFQKSLSYASNSDNNAGLYTEYANFLIRQGDFKHAFEYLQKSIKSNNKTLNLQYREMDKDIIADILIQAIKASGQEEIKLNAKEYAYYLLIANYNNFVSSGIGKIEDQYKYLEQFIQHSMNTEKISYTSCLLLAKACYLCDRVTDATIFALVPLVYQMYKLEQHNDLNDTEIDTASDGILMGHITEQAQ